jgi:MFS family permease
MADLQFGPVGLGAATGVFYCTMGLASPYLGRTADRLGARISLRIGGLGAALSSAVIATLAMNWVVLAVALLMAGCAMALTQPGANRLLSKSVDTARLGTAFGLKQSAPPVATMLAGLSVPVFAATVGWRWAFLVAALFGMVLIVLVGSGPQISKTESRIRHDLARQPLGGRLSITVLGLGLGLSFAAASVAFTFYVDAAVDSGSSEPTAGLILAFASAAAIAMRFVSGVLCDRTRLDPAWLTSGLVAVGSLGLFILSIRDPTAMAIGITVALAGTWGFQSAFWYMLVRAYPDSPGRITGTIGPASLGGIFGPIAFGFIANRSSYSEGWVVAASLAALAAGVILFGTRMLRHPH